MSNTLISNKFKEHLASQFIESITEPANTVYYLVASKHTPFSNTTGDSVVPVPYDTLDENTIKVFEESIFGKKITSQDVMLMIPRYNWTTNTVYTPYNNSDAELASKQYYVAVDGGSNYYVYKVLDNNNGANSVTQPSSTSESACSFITTSDGYTWKLMYTMPESTFEKFATNEYMPVVTSANVAGNTVSGAIDVIKVSNNGSNYIATLTGQFQADDIRELIPAYSGNTTTYRLSTSASSNTNFYVGSALYISSGPGAGQIRRIISYDGSSRVAVVNTAFTTPPSQTSQYTIAPNVTITGDGSGATGYATVSSNATVNNYISKINIVSRGTNYTYGNATLTGNTGGISNSAILQVIIPPIGGHGANAPDELGCKSVGISLKYNTNESGYIPVDNDFRKIIVLRDPLFKNVTFTLSSVVGTFTNNETIYQIDRKPLIGTVSGNTTSQTITGSSTRFDVSFKQGDYILITDNSTGASCIRQVDGVTNSTSLTVTANLSFVTAFGAVEFASVTASGKKVGNTVPYMTLANVEPKFVTNKIIIGASSGAVANVTNIDVGEKNYNNWNTFDNRTRISYTTSSGSMPEDAQVFQTDITLSNAFFHSANSTYVFLTSEKGPINADPAEQLRENSGSAYYVLGSVKYTPDLEKGSGKAIYIKNTDPISRSISQSETIKLIINF